MRRVVVDASVLAAIVFGEEGGVELGRSIEGAQIYAPTLLRYEMQNVALQKIRRVPQATRPILEALERSARQAPSFVWMDPNPTDVALLAHATGLSAYDASYLWLAGFVGADLVTADRQLAEAFDAFAAR